MISHTRDLILVDGKDRTDSVAKVRFVSDMCEVVYAGSATPYHYRRSRVQVLKFKRQLDPAAWLVTVNGRQLQQVKAILDFEKYYRIIYTNEKVESYSQKEVQLHQNCLADEEMKNVFEYFKETASAVSLIFDKFNILGSQYERCKTISSETVLAKFLDRTRKLKKHTLPKTILYPFGLNQSQKVAVENAFSSQVSVIQGPPGTGKTQTILNIIANAVYNGQTVAVVSSNNSAILNVKEKLEKKGLSFLTAFLGSNENKASFLENQSGEYPDMTSWAVERQYDKERLERELSALSKELDEMLRAKNRIAEIHQELLELKPEQYYFNEYYKHRGQRVRLKIEKMSSERILSLWIEYERYTEQCARPDGGGPEGRRPIPKWLRKMVMVCRFGRHISKIFSYDPEEIIAYLQHQFYIVRHRELMEEKASLNEKLKKFSFDTKMKELEEKSLRMLQDKLSRRYGNKKQRTCFSSEDFWKKASVFTKEYPVILSTTYSVKKVLDANYIYDYLIVDEASQVDLATGVLAFSSARNIVIVGDLQQLPNILKSTDVQKSEAIWNRYSLPEVYHFSTHSLLSAAVEAWPDSPKVLLREHYRCHPKIIQFCNQKFYDGKLIVMTEDHDEADVLTIYRTAPGNHARGRKNQRQIDVIREEVMPRLEKQGYQDIGIITPYRDQVEAMKAQLGRAAEVETVHKFQGREKEAIILSSVDNVITKFVDDPKMLNVAVSRAIRSLTVIVSQDPRNKKTNYGDLTRYVEYNNCEITNSEIYSVFDLLYQGYARERRAFLQKRKKVSEYDSENLLYTVIEDLLKRTEFSVVSCAIHVSLAGLFKDYSRLTKEETQYARNPLTHVDFLLFHKIGKLPLMAIEVDGTSTHAPGSVQQRRDQMKNRIFEKYHIPLLRLRTDESGEKERIEHILLNVLQRKQ